MLETVLGVASYLVFFSVFASFFALLALGLNLQWGMAASPLVVDDVVVVLPGGPNGHSVAAYDRRTGAPAWTALDDKQAYAAPMLATLGGVRQIVVLSAERLLGLAPDGSRVLWEYPWKTFSDINAAQPLVISDTRIFVSSGYGVGGAVVELDRRLAGRPGGHGQHQARPALVDVLEQGLERPLLEVAVGGGHRGVVAAASYEAREFGVRSAMPSVTAKRRCPELIFVKPRFDVYRSVSHQIRAIFAEYTDLIEPLSLDEAYLDVTEDRRGLGTARAIAEEIRDRIRSETGLTASAGVSYCKFIAKLASDQNKPDGLCVIPPAKGPAFVAALPVKRFHGVGPVTAAKMERLGILTGADLARWPIEELETQFGSSGRWYWRIARGIDEREVKSDRPYKSVSAERTFDVDYVEAEDLRRELNRARKSQRPSGKLGGLAQLNNAAEDAATDPFVTRNQAARRHQRAWANSALALFQFTTDQKAFR